MSQTNVKKTLTLERAMREAIAASESPGVVAMSGGPGESVSAPAKRAESAMV